MREQDLWQFAKRATLPVNTALSLAMAACGSGAPDVPLGKTNSPSSSMVKDIDPSEFALPLDGPSRFTGGPHDTYRKGGKRNSIDVAPKVKMDCPPGVKKFLDEPAVVASASGKVTAIGDENNPQDKIHSIIRVTTSNGINVETMHVGKFKVKVGDIVEAGKTRIASLACAAPPGGDISQGGHAHVGLFSTSGEPISIEDHKFSGWTVKAGGKEYDGTLTKPGEDMRTADTRDCDGSSKILMVCGGIRNDLNGGAVLGVKAEPTRAAVINTATSTPTATPRSSLAEAKPNLFKVGDPAEVNGTKPQCLNVREKPAASAKVLDCIQDGTKVSIESGPEKADNYTWWKLKGWGWGVETYLQSAGTSKPPEVLLRTGIGKLGQVDLNLADRDTRSVFFRTHGGHFTLQVPSSWRGNNAIMEVLGDPYNGYQTHIKHLHLREGALPNLEALKEHQLKILNNDIEQASKRAGKTAPKAEFSKENVAGRDAYLIRGIMPKGSYAYRATGSGDPSVDLEVNYVVFMDGNQPQRFGLFTHPGATQQALPNFVKTINSYMPQ